MIHCRLGMLLAICLMVLGAVPARAEEEPETTRPAPKPRVVFVDVAGVRSGGQAVAVARTIREAGVKELKWTKPRKALRLVRVGGHTDERDLRAASMPEGVTLTVVPTEIKAFVFAKRLHCNGCLTRISKGLRDAAGVREFKVAEDWRSVTVTFDTRKSNVAKIQKILEGAGYSSTVADA